MLCHFWQSYQRILVGTNLLCIALTNRILKRDEKTFSWFEIPRLPQNPLTLSQFCDSSFFSLPIDLKWNVWTPNFCNFIAVPQAEHLFLCCQCCQSPEDIFYRWISTSIWEISGTAVSPSYTGHPLTFINYFIFRNKTSMLWTITFNSIAANMNRTLNTTQNTTTTTSSPYWDFCFHNPESLGDATLFLDR
jgi:hypothetical protein